jgi:hypothetical protein
MRTLALITCMALSLAVAGGCGDEDKPETTTTADATTPTTTTSTTTAADTDFQPEPCPGADSPPNIVDVTSYGTDCGAVEDAMAELRGVSREFRIGDFECSRTEGMALSGKWKCRGEASYFTFTFGD